MDSSNPAPGPDPWERDADAVATELDTDVERGLGEALAARRLAADGPNELQAAAPIPTWRKILAQFQDPLIYLLMGAVVVSVVAWFIEGQHGWPVDAIVIAVIVIANAILGYVQEARAADAVHALREMAAATAGVIRDGQLRRVPARDVVRGDLLDLVEGDNVAADGRLVHAAGLRIAEAALTGESEAVDKDPAPLVGPTALGDRRNMVFAGTSVTQGVGRVIVTAIGQASEMGKIADLLHETREEPTPLEREIGLVGRVLGVAVLVIAGVVMATIFLTSDVQTLDEGVTVLLLGVSLAVAAVPEGLPTILTVVLSLGVQRMAARQAIVTTLSSVETLGSASVICSDKTGTLTRSEMTIERVVTASGEARLTGVGYAPEGCVQHDGRELEEGTLRLEVTRVLVGGRLANDAVLREEGGEWTIQGDPTDAAFLAAEPKLGADAGPTGRYERVGEVPFTSDRKLMSSVEIDSERDGRLDVFTKGAPDVLLLRCTHLRVGDRVLPLDDERRRKILEDVERLSGEAYRTLAVAYRELDSKEHPNPDTSLEEGLTWLGMVGMIDPPRAEAAVAIQEARRAGIRILMITGDHPATAARIAADLGIIAEGEPAITGLALDEMDDDALVEAVRRTSVYARVSPQHKLRIVDALQADGKIVAMTGDGVNDAPALKSADIGVAMGITGTEVTRQAAKMILADDNFATIVHAVREGRNIFENIKKFLRYLLSSNMGEVLTVFFGVVFAGVLGLSDAAEGAVVLPLLATQILWINLLTDTGPALAMGIDPENDDVMGLPPRPLTERVIGARMWVNILVNGLTMAVVTLGAIDLYLPGGLISGDQSLDTARTAGFTVLVFTQLFNAFNSRSESASVFHRLFVNRWLWAAVGLSLALQVAVVHVPFLQTAFGTAPLDLQQWLVCAALASVVLWVSELRKVVNRARG